ncbi:MAG: RNA polymerase sigma factor [Pseudonocardiaceae bacterium]
MTTATISYLPPNANANASVADLLLRIGDRDSSAWDEILRRYSELVTMIVRSFRMQEADRHDAIQMTWLRLAEYADRVQFPERLGGWLATTARRECIHILRQAKRGPSLTDRTPEFVADPSDGPEQRAIDAEIARILRALVDELPPRQQTLIKTQFTDDPPSYAEIAHLTDIPLGAIGPTRARALRQLRNKAPA